MTICAREIRSSVNCTAVLNISRTRGRTTKVLKEELISTKFTCDMDEVEMPWRVVILFLLLSDSRKRIFMVLHLLFISAYCSKHILKFLLPLSLVLCF